MTSSLAVVDPLCLLVPPPPKNAKSPRTAKIRRLLGDDAPEAPQVNGVEELETPWYLRPTYGESDVILAPNGSVRGGKLSALVERLTLHDKRGNSVFFFCYLDLTAHEIFT
jgi:son of sevenless